MPWPKLWSSSIGLLAILLPIKVISEVNISPALLKASANIERDPVIKPIMLFIAKRNRLPIMPKILAIFIFFCFIVNHSFNIYIYYITILLFKKNNLYAKILLGSDTMFKYTLDNKRYHTLNYYYKKKYGIKVFKLSLNAGFTCPNIDGTKGYGGCIYCSKTGSGEFGGDIHKSLTEQVSDMKKIVNKKNIPCKYIGYFQARTNTYAPVDVLKKKYEEVLKCDDIIGLNIATRCDA